MNALQDKIAVVTGSTRGFGYAIAEALLQAGAAVAVTGRTPQAIARQRKDFAEIRLFKPWTPLLGLLRIGWENLTKTGATPEFELRYREPYRFKGEHEEPPKWKA